jgi:hypothetical protein
MGKKNTTLTKKGEEFVSKMIQEDPKGYLIGNIEDIFDCYEKDKDKTVMVLDLFAVQEILAQHGYRAIDLMREEINEENKKVK